jgi:phage terminase Nu1 subunit (DNA packaging protein)
MELYQKLVESARARLADLELDYGIEKSKVDSIRSKLFAALRPFYQERDRLRLLVQFRKAFIDRLLGEEAAEATAGDYQREAAEEDESVIGRIVAAQRTELEQEIADLQAEAERVAEEARELAGEVPF